jgi:hypothetical protein
MEEACGRGEGKELVCQPFIKDQNRLKKLMINKKSIPVQFKDQQIDSCAIYSTFRPLDFFNILLQYGLILKLIKLNVFLINQH